MNDNSRAAGYAPPQLVWTYHVPELYVQSHGFSSSNGFDTDGTDCNPVSHYFGKC